MSVQDAASSMGALPSGPQISVVLPVFNGAEYLQACLDSILQQSFSDIEVIAVNGGSDEKAVREILDRGAEQDHRLRVVHEGKIGPGRARNTGVENARGEYLWFVDADDLLPPDSLRAVAVAARLHMPDVLVTDFEYLLPGGNSKPSPGKEIIAAAAGANYTLAQKPELLDLTMTSWSKVVRREFFISTGIKFAPGIHEDVPITCALLLDANHISVLDRVCYYYRQRRRGAFMTTTSRKHLDIFDSYRGVLDDLEKRLADDDGSVTPAVRDALFRRAIWHYTTLLRTGGLGIGPVGISGLVPRSVHRGYFRNMHDDFERYRPPGYRAGKGARAAMFRLIEHDHYWIYSVLEPVNKLRVLLRRVGAGTRPLVAAAQRRIVGNGVSGESRGAATD
jgi:CDP-glycerol glycerophosphotransferase